jgi:hypothetical protein
MALALEMSGTSVPPAVASLASRLCEGELSGEAEATARKTQVVAGGGSGVDGAMHRSVCIINLARIIVKLGAAHGHMEGALLMGM